MSDKTHFPTPQKLKKARNEGQFPKSRVALATVPTVAGVLMILATLQAVAKALQTFTIQTLSLTRTMTNQQMLRQALSHTLETTGPILAATFLAALAIGISQAGFQMRGQLLAPKFERINPMSGFKRIFSFDNLKEVLKSLIYGGILGFALWKVFSVQLPQWLALIPQDLSESFKIPWLAFAAPVKTAMALLAVAAAIDLLLAKKSFLKKMMMSRQEVKEEYKSSEGDPQHKSARKALHQEIIAQGIQRGVAGASVVVVNPTHVAVALRYNAVEADAPYLVAKGEEMDALQIRQEARRLGIPIVRNIGLARSLVKQPLGEMIPEELYQAAAAVLSLAIENSKHSKP